MTFRLQNNVGVLVPFGGGPVISLSSVRSSNELYRLAHGVFFVYVGGTPRLKIVDLHACRGLFRAWTKTIRCLCCVQQKPHKDHTTNTKSFRLFFDLCWCLSLLFEQPQAARQPQAALSPSAWVRRGRCRAERDALCVPLDSGGQTHARGSDRRLCRIRRYRAPVRSHADAAQTSSIGSGQWAECKASTSSLKRQKINILFILLLVLILLTRTEIQIL
jgi:hypothetical protein